MVPMRQCAAAVASGNPQLLMIRGCPLNVVVRYVCRDLYVIVSSIDIFALNCPCRPV
jgi:hypothetical protein